MCRLDICEFVLCVSEGCTTFWHKLVKYTLDVNRERSDIFMADDTWTGTMYGSWIIMLYKDK